MKKIAMIAGALALTASVASAAGINLSWNDCGTNGTPSTTFLCDGNTGNPFTAVASFVPPSGIDNFLGISSQIDITTTSATLPDWWKHGTGQCRATSGMSISFDFTIGPFTCVDFYNGQAAGGSAYDVGFGSPARGRLRIQCAVPFDNRGPVSPASEVYAYKMSLLRSKSSGTGSCAGCATPACIVLNSIQLFQPPDALNDPELSNPVNSNYVTWQATSVPGCPLSTPNTRSSWGQVKSLYR
jgi:hypothetical protein